MTEQELIDLLNDDLAHELQAITQYLTYAAKVNGPYRPELSEFFLAEIPEETEHAKYLANKIVALGGEPTTTAATVPSASTNREMLQAVFEAESGAVDRYAERSEQAEKMGMKGLQVQLEDMCRDETEHRDEVARILRDWSV